MTEPSFYTVLIAGPQMDNHGDGDDDSDDAVHPKPNLVFWMEVFAINPEQDLDQHGASGNHAGDTETARGELNKKVTADSDDRGKAKPFMPSDKEFHDLHIEFKELGMLH